jgi:hypothetical protein
MAEPGKSARKPRVRIRFVASLRAASPRDDDDPLVAAINPEPTWTLEVEAPPAPVKAYGLWHPMDLASGDTLKLLSIERDTAGLDGAAYIGRIREQVLLLIPELDDEVFEQLSTQQLLAIGRRAWQRPTETKPEASAREADAGNPPGGERASAISSRSPDGSLVGAMGS